MIDPAQLLSALESDLSLPKNAVLITFDDCYESYYRLAAPVLKYLGIRALVFIPTYYVERQKPFWFDVAWSYIKQSKPDELIWLMDVLGLKYQKFNRSIHQPLFINTMKRMLPEVREKLIDRMEHELSGMSQSDALNRLYYPLRYEQIRELAEEGTIFGGHTHTHTILTVMPDWKADSEIVENKSIVEDLLSRPCHFFAYPNGGHADYNNAHKLILRRVGYKAAFSLTQRRSSIYEDAMDISRINAAPEDTVTSLLFRCTGVMSIITLLRRYVETE